MVKEVKSSEIPSDESLLVYNLQEINKRLETWKSNLSRVKPFYAVKCNTDINILKRMVELGLSFDCASKSEIQTILELGVDPQNIVYANPCKQISHLIYSYKNGVRLTTFDSLNELEKLSKFSPKMKCLLRLATDDSKAVCTMSEKYGATVNEVNNLLIKAKEFNVEVVGFAFHVGSASEDNLAFSKALLCTKKAIDIAINLNINITIIDIGGGFPGNTDSLFNQLVLDLNRNLEKHFPKNSEKQISIIAEPGRYFVASCATLYTSVIGFKRLESGHIRYFLSEGVYGILSCIIFDHAKIIPKVKKREGLEEKTDASLWGPSCDGFDCIMKSIQLPILKLGDQIYFENIGAYSTASSTNFNGLCNPNYKIDQ